MGCLGAGWPLKGRDLDLYTSVASHWMQTVPRDRGDSCAVDSAWSGTQLQQSGSWENECLDL